jgi:predicted nuclease of predicted toxin-antitoxin system
MRFVVDNQLPPSLSRFLADAGHDSLHVAMVNLDAASDAALWQWATREDRIVVSKDEDLFFLANRRGDCGRLLWVRIGNCRRDALHRAFERALPSIVAAFESGQRIVELA